MSIVKPASAKQLLRQHILAVSKRVCKEHPAFRQEQSIMLCETLFHLIENSKKSSSPAECFIPNSSPKSIGLYLPLYFEIDVEPLVRKLLQSSIKVFVPEIYPTGENSRKMRFVQVLSHQDLDENFKAVPPFNIKEPPKKEDDPLWNERIRFDSHSNYNNSNNLDVLIVPGVAFDYECNRLGKGAGFYDRWIEGDGEKDSDNKKPRNNTLLVGVCFDQQLPKIKQDESSWWTDLKNNGGDAPLELHTVPMESWDKSLDRMVTPKKIIVA